jgi:hypothetical protein
MWMTKRAFWIIFCIVQALGLLLAGIGESHSNYVLMTIGLILLLPGLLPALALFAAFNILKSGSFFLLAPGIVVALGVNVACCFAVWYAIESKLKKNRSRLKAQGIKIETKR